MDAFSKIKYIWTNIFFLFNWIIWISLNISLFYKHLAIFTDDWPIMIIPYTINQLKLFNFVAQKGTASIKNRSIPG